MRISSINYYLAYQAATRPHAVAFNFVHHNDEPSKTESITYSNLLDRVKNFSRQIADNAALGDRAILLYSPGIDYIVAFFSCLWAGVVAVPAYPIRNNHYGRKIEGIFRDCSARLILACEDEWPNIQDMCTTLFAGDSAANLLCEGLTKDAAEYEINGFPEGNEIAFLQYTSGSTGDPKGVMVSHENLLHNLSEIQRKFGNTHETVMVSWLPPYHDMGLISAIIEPVFVGFPVTLLSPFAFIQKPSRWLQLISDLRATVSGGPNFAFDLCVDRVTPEQKRNLDLSSLRIMYSGAEPILPGTLNRFCTSFVDAGFRPAMLYPCYGLAEATLFVSGGEADDPPYVLNDGTGTLLPLSVTAHGDERSSGLVGCGKHLLGQDILIVDPQTKTPVPTGEEGEIWLRGPSVAMGYWGREQLSKSTFEAYTSCRNGPYLRTGDLGFSVDNELIVTGRIKDLIIVRGRKYYPQDIERAVEEEVRELRPSCGAAIQSGAAGDGMVFIAEIERTARKLEPPPLLARIRAAIGVQFQLQPEAIVILQPGKTLKTSSGKIQRSLMKKELTAGNLDVWGEWRLPKL